VSRLLSWVIRHEDNTMNNPVFRAVFCVSVVLLTSCGRQQGPPQVAAPAGNAPPAPPDVKADTNPSLKIESRQELPFGGGAKGTVWSLRGQKVKELTARLLICTDGKADNNNEISCQWNDTSKPMHGQLVLLVQDGQPFGVKGKRLASLGLSFSSGGPSSKIERSSSALISSDLPSRMSTATDATSISAKEVLYRELSAPLKEGAQAWNLGGSEEELVKSSKDGSVVLAVILEWKQ
jgi:hypothetical protein